jgi:hypothetical protein
VAIARAGTAALSNSGGSAATTATATLASTNPGDYNIIVVSANTSGATSPDPAQTCTGGSGTWTTIATSEKSGSPSHRLTAFGKFYVAGDANPTVTIAASGNIENAAIAYSGVDTTTPIASGEAQAQAQASSSTAFATPSITTAAARWLISAAGDRTASTTWTGTDSLLLTGAAANAANLIVQDSNGMVAAGTYSRTLTASAATSVGNALIFALNPASSGTIYSDSATMTSGSSLSGAGNVGNSATMTSGSSLTGSATASLAASAGMTSASSLAGAARTPIVQQLLTGGTQWPAHRDGTYATYGEETLEGYTAALAQYSKAILEISVWDTSDGVYVCSHDQTLTRVFGDSRTITSVTWANLSPNGSSTTGRPVTTVGGNPLRRIEEILDAFPHALFIVENKHGTNQGTLSTLLDSHGAGRWMFKGPYNDTANANIAAGHGAPMWLYFYPSQLGSLSTTYSAVSGSGVPIVFGLGDYSTAPVPVQSDANTFFSFTTSNGLMAWAHILGTTGQKSTADSQASAAGSSFNGYMTSAYSTLAPNDSTTASMTSGSSLAGSATLGAAVSAGMVSGSALTGSASAIEQAGSGMASSSSLAGTASAVLQATAGMTSASSLAGTETAGAQVSGGMTSGSSLTGALTVGAPESAAMISGSALAGSASVIESVTAGMSSASTLTGAGTAVVPESAGMTSGTSLSGQGALGVPMAAGMTSASNLSSAVALVVAVAAASMTSASALTGSGLTGAGGAMTSGSSLAGDATGQAGGSAGMASGSALTGAAAAIAAAQAGMVSGSLFTAGASLTATAVASMVSASILTAAATSPTPLTGLTFKVTTSPGRWHVTTSVEEMAVNTGG